MITIRPSFDSYLDEYYGLSTDTKPTGEHVVNGSTFIEMDTSKKYYYDEENKLWYDSKGSNGEDEPSTQAPPINVTPNPGA